MKKLLFFTTLAVFSLTSINAQEKTTKSDVKKATDAVENEAIKQYNKAKTGGFKVGANIGLPLQDAGDVSSFNIGADIAWLWEIADNLEIGGLTGYTHFFGDGSYNYYDGYGKAAAKSIDGVVAHYKDAGFIPVAATARYYFSDRKMFAGLDLGYAINITGDADGGLYVRPKFGYNMGKINLIGSFQRVGGGVKYHDGLNTLSVSGYSSINVGAEIAF